MRISRRGFIKTGSILAVGSNLFLSHACRSVLKKEKTDRILIDFIGPEEYYNIYLKYFRHLNKVKLLNSSLEQAIDNKSHAALIFAPLDLKATLAIMLLEQGKDVLLAPPLAGTYEEFDILQLQCNTFDRRIGLLDPYRFYPGSIRMRELLQTHLTNITGIEIVVNPAFNEPDWWPYVDGYCGPAANLCRLVSWMIMKNPLSVKTNEFNHTQLLKYDPALNFDLDIGKYKIHYKSSITTNGWLIRVTGTNTSVVLDHEGNLNQKITAEDPDYNKAKSKLTAIHNCLNDFIEAVRTRKEPEVNSLDGMAGIALNQAVLKSAETRKTIRMIMNSG